MREESTYFGYDDARQENENEVISYFYDAPNSIYRSLKMNTESRGICIVHAPKGAGKTQLRRVLAHRATAAGDAVWTIDEDLTRTIERPDRGPAHIKRELSGLLLSGITAKLLSDESLKTRIGKQWWDKTKDIFSRMGEVPQSVTMGPATVSVDMHALFRDTKPKFSQAPIEEYQELLGYLLERRRCYVLIDDVDEVFDDAYTHPQIIEGLLRSVVDLNLKFLDRLHTIVFLKTGLYGAYYRQAVAHNEIRQHVGFLGWSKDNLVNLLAHRIGRKHNLPDGNKTPTGRWLLEFEDANSRIDQIQEYLIDRCNYGPRDLIMFANGAKDHAGNRRIGIADVMAAEARYCRQKLQVLVGDYGRPYPEINNLISRVFTGGQNEYDRDEFEIFIRTNVIQNSDFRDEEPFRKYIRFADEREISRLLFEMGFLGFRLAGNEPYRYSMSDPSLDDWSSALSYKIHPAFGTCLQLKQRSQSRQ